MAHYFDDPSAPVFDTRKEFRTNVEHIVAENKARFPKPYRSMDDYTVQTFLKGAIDNVKERVKRNYKTAIPQYYRSRVQLLLPLCLRKPNRAELRRKQRCGSDVKMAILGACHTSYGVSSQLPYCWSYTRTHYFLTLSILIATMIMSFH